MYTKTHQKQNELITTRARALLANMSQAAALEILAKEFHTITRQRLRGRLDKVARQLRGEEVRARGGQGNNKNAAKPETKIPWSRRFAKPTIGKLARQARKRGMSQTAYIEWLIDQDK